MLKTENTSRVCDICFASPSRVYCRKDLAYLCASCDSRNHVASCHERVSICDSCGSAPAAFLCKADAASLCIACDSEIHSVNPLARRHYRVPAPPIGGGEKLFMCNKEEQDESFGDESWLFGGEDHVDEYLDLDDYDHHHQQQQQHFSSTVSVPQKSYYDVCDMNYLINGNDHYCSEYEGSNSGNYCPDNNSFMSHSISLSSMDVGVVPESTTSQVSISHHHNNNRPPKGITELFAGNQIPIPTQLTPMDREARVLRYREKKKTRKFEKTIRYASRKAYAETRPRIKGRFTKTKDGESEVDQMLCTSLMESESVYGVVPSF